ncbi:MAG: oxygen-independent coproporphyrinogen III oxidase [Planctomycetes bacterium]|nr:oxygen-independent coproporphyrinogen III oxidase [Planctomycetota bacterium]
MTDPSVTAELLEKYGGPAPRYTSYPTALDWKDDVGPDDYPELLRSAGEREGPLSLYVHVPFCEKRCLFCGCNVKITRDREWGRKYVELLRREAETAGRNLGGREVHEIHWGGGTPTWLAPDELTALWDAVGSAFSVSPDVEAAVEVDPRVTSDEQLRLLAHLGFRRLSLGIQDFDPLVQATVQRVQSVEDTARTVAVARDAGFRSVNVDLMYGLPRQTRDGFQTTLDHVVALRPDRVALFGYAHVPWLKKHHRALDTAVAPTPAEKLVIFKDAVQAFTSAGWVFLGLDHFALTGDPLACALADGTLNRNFMGYTTRPGDDTIGLGVSAIGEVGGAYVQNARELTDWQDAVRDRGVAVVRGHRLNAEDRLRRDAVMRIMCHGRLRWADLDAAHGPDTASLLGPERAALASLAEDGLVHLNEDSVQVTGTGRVFLRQVAAVFDRYLRDRDGQDAFSRVI